MSKKTFLFILAAVLVLLTCCGCSVQAVEDTPSPTESPAPAAEPTPEPLALSLADPAGHPAFLTVDEDGYFRSYQRVTRMEACLAFYEVADGWKSGNYLFTDLSAGQEGYAEAASLCRAGVFPVGMGEAFSPGKALSREEMMAFLELLAGSLAGDERARVEELAADVREGVLARDGIVGSTVSRGEFAVIMVRLSGREPNEAAILVGDYLPVDVDTESYAWLSIADAITEGVMEDPAEGVYRVGNTLYGVGADGNILRDTDYGVWTFGPDGSYTTGNAELDACLRAAVTASGADKLSGEEALKAVYLHVKYDYEYLVTPADMIVEEPAATGWENERALRFFQNGGGTCYGFAAAFGLLARSLGEHAYIVSAQVNQYYAPHGFVVIPENGVDWIYDVEMEATRMERHKDLELYRIQNYSTYSYWYTPDW